jgi:hypothetical protein
LTAPTLRRKTVAGLTPAALSRRAAAVRRSPQALRAAGIRIERMAPDKMRAIAGQRQRWQAMAWGYRDMIGELRAALKFRAQAISRVRFFVAQIQEDDDEPIAVSARSERDKDGKPTERAGKITLPEDICAAAEAELARLPLDAGDSFLGIWSENFDVAGECWLYAHLDPDTEEEVWEIRSIDDVDVQGSTVTIKDALGQAQPVDLSPDSNEELYRMWCKHPRHPHLADSALNACLDSLEDITLIAREMRAAARSRIATNGIALVPEGLADLMNVEEDDDRSPHERFTANFTAAVVAPISNEGDAGAIAPIVLMGSIEDLNAFRFVRIDREDSPTLVGKLDKALARMGQSIDVPPEIITGLSDVNHWTAWQIDSSTFRYYLEPGIRLMADSLTQCFLRNALKGFPPEEIRQIRVWFDAGAITENPNRQQDTILALDHMLVGPRTGRKELGFNEGDAPTPEEIIQMIASKQGFDAAAAARIMTYLATRDGADLPPEVTSSPSVPQPRQLPPATAPTPPAPDETGVGGTGAPDMKPPGLAASATPDATGPQWRLESVLGHQLADIERALRDQILLAADGAVIRALERAGSRLRSKAQRQPDLVAALRREPVTNWAFQLGRTHTFGLGADLRYLLKDAFTELGGKFNDWVHRAVDALVARVLKFLKLDPASTAGKTTADRMRGAMQGRTDLAWAQLHAALEARTERLLFDGAGEPLADGEQTNLSIPADLVRNALAVIGGLPETAAGVDDTGRIPTGEPFTGFADGTTVTGELDAHGVVPFGREWQYNPTLARNTFEPHYDLDGTRFTSWIDPKLKAPPEYAWIGPYFRPKDHLGCLCTTAVTYAVPEPTARPIQDEDASSFATARAMEQALASQLRERLRQPSQSLAYTIELAEKDDREGRKHTIAQQTRDQYNEVQRLQSKFLNGE